MQIRHALTRRPGTTLASGLTTSTLGAPDFARAIDQFEAYVDALRGCSVEVVVLDPLDDYPDAHFVEDVAVVTPQLAVLTRPGAGARRGEVAFIESALRPHRTTVSLASPGILDGGDVLMVGQHLYIGRSERTDEAGAAQLGRALAPFGYAWTLVPVAAGLHLKSSITAVGDRTLLTTQAFADHPALAGFDRIVVPEGEEYASNTLLVNDRLLMPSGFPRTRQKLQALEIPLVELDTSEFRKMDGALTCLSLRF